jgi:HK97 family phage prohead protease
MENMQVKILPMEEFKAITEDGKLTISGYANTKNKPDRYGDKPTVFSDLRDYVYDLKEFKKNPVMLMNHENKIEKIAGSYSQVKEDEKGLFVKGVFSDSDLPEIKHARKVYSEGHAKALSIAGRFHFEDKDNADNLTLAEIYEISLVAIPADPDAMVSAEKKCLENLQKRGMVKHDFTENNDTNSGFEFKAHKIETVKENLTVENKTVPPYQNFPLSIREKTWSASEAASRVRQFTDSVDEPSSDYKKAFFYYDPEMNDKFGGYKLPYVDIVDGKMVAVFRALAAVAGRLNQTQIPQSDKDKIVSQVNKYYAKAREQYNDPNIISPFEREMTPQNFKELNIILKDKFDLGRKKREAIIACVKEALLNDDAFCNKFLDKKYPNLISNMEKIKQVLQKIG